MARRGHNDDDDEPRSTAATTGGGQEAVTLNDEEAIRAKLRESGWEKKKRKESENDDTPAVSARKNSDHDTNANDRKAKENDREREHDSRRRGSAKDSGRRDRRSCSRRRDDRRDRDSRRRRDRSAKRGKPSSRRRSPSSSKSRSPSRSRRVSSSHKRRGASPSRSVSKGRESGSTKSRGHASKSRSPSREPSRKKKEKDDADMDTDPDVEETGKDKEKSSSDGKDATASEAMDIDEEGGEKKPSEPEENGEKKKERASSAGASRKGRKSSRHHSPSKSRSPSRSSRRRRHRSRSRSPSHRSRRSRRSSRSRSRSRAHRSDRRRRRSKSHSRSNSRRYRRSSSKDKKRHDANRSPEPHEHPAGVATAAPPIPAPVVNVNPTITQLMQQYPTMSLQEIIAKMQASNVTMAAAVSMKPARELYVGNLPPNVTGPQLQEFLGTIIQQVGLCAQPGNPILNTWISTDGHFAFCEMRSVEECNLALLLNQLSLLGQPLKFGRPRSFMGPPQPIPVVSSRTQTALVNLGCTPNPVWFASPGFGATTSLGAVPAAALPIPTMPTVSVPAPYVASSYVAPPAPAGNPAAFLSSLPADANSKKLLMSNIPIVLVEDQVKELVEPFGELKSFTLVTDKVTGASTGNALFEYQDEGVAEEALQGLSGLDIGGIPLSIRRAPHDANGLLPADESSVVVKLVRGSAPHLL